MKIKTKKKAHYFFPKKLEGKLIAKLKTPK